jgi:saccharopine dehydrogenase-like NADP-dependent oxidoreductase
MSKKPVVVYGASGYTGRLVAEHLRQYGIPFIAAGRNRARIEEAMAKVPGIETADYEIVEVEHNVDALTALFTGRELVCNTVGPFLYYGFEVAEACANAEVHYLDSGGEVAVLTAFKEKFHEAFAANGKVLAPSTAYMYTVLEIAARKVLETPGIDSLECLCAPTGTPTYGSTQTILAMFSTADQSFYLQNNQMVTWPAAKGYEVNMPGQIDTLLTHPWGGGTLPLYFQDDPRVRNVRQLTGFTDRGLMEALIQMQLMYETEIKVLPADQQTEKLKALGESMQPGMPPRENPLVHRNIDVVHGRGGNVALSCEIRSVMPYQTTGLIIAATANFLLNGQQLSAGFTSACVAVGHNEIFGQMQNFGLAEMTVG